MNYNKLKCVIVLLIILNILDSITTSYFISKTNIYVEGNLLLVYLFERFNYNFVLFMKVLVFTFVCLVTYKKSIIGLPSSYKYHRYILYIFIGTVIFLFLVVFGNTYAILKI